MNYQLLIGDCLDTLKTLPAQSVHTCVTSPPYFGLRDYGVEGQLGAEPTPDEFVDALVRVFREVRRVLRDDGTVWLNLGDSYNAYNGNRGTNSKYAGDREKFEAAFPSGHGLAVKDLKQKDLIGIPWRVAFALQADGWYLRQDIIWHKPNPMPESVRDRCTKAHEYVFLLSKSPKYYYDHEAAKEDAVGKNAHDLTGCGYKAPGQAPNTGNRKALRSDVESRRRSSIKGGQSMQAEPNGKRNRRSVWTVTTRPYKGAHFATFPPDLIQPCILAGCPEGGTVLDPFGGSGTTAGVALAHGRDAVLCELSPEYAALVPERIDWITDYYKVPRVTHPHQETPAKVEELELDPLI